MHYDILSQLKNAGRARKETVHMPFSQFDFAILNLLREAGYLHDVQKRNVGKKSVIDVKLKYDGKQSKLSDFRIMSKPSRRLYRSYRELQLVKQGYGIAVLSTPEGILTGAGARKKKVGGEYLFEVW